MRPLDVDALACSYRIEQRSSGERVIRTSMRKVQWYRTLGFQAIALPILSLAVLVVGIVLVMSTKGKALVLTESSRRIEQSGSSVVLYLSARLGEIGALTRTVAEVAERLPKTEATFHEMVPSLLEFQGDRGVAGGGVWPEPFAFQPGVERRSFFWGRGEDGGLRYFDDYNTGQGYHREGWYAIAKHLPEGGSFWSESYMDPYSRELMVTCTVPTFERGAFTGAVTVDLKLDGLQAFADRLDDQTGGYIFIVDRNNRFITFPKPELARRTVTRDGKETKEFLTAAELARETPIFAPIAEALEAMNRDIVERARTRAGPGYSSKIAGDPDLAAANAELMAAVVADPLRSPGSYPELYKKLALEDDFLLGEPAGAYIFNVPGVYWKVVMVKPDAEATLVASDISRVLLFYILATTIAIIGASFYGVNRLIVRPLLSTIRDVHWMGRLVAQGRFNEIERVERSRGLPNEIGLLDRVLKQLGGRIVDQNKKLEDYSHNLEQKVEQRTRELALATEEAREAMEKSERLLLNILPKPIAERLKQGQSTIADSFQEVTVIFADIVGFTPLSSQVPAVELVGMMNVIFSAFDRLTERHNLEKIKTIGDAYMAVAGLPVPREGHAQAAAEMALDMLDVIDQFSAERGMSLSLRIGINTGPVIAGIIGEKKFIYDLWGDTVNIASRMESHGLPGSIHVAEPTYKLLADEYVFECRGTIQVKGKGEMKTYILHGSRRERTRRLVEMPEDSVVRNSTRLLQS
jgi:class 3 adenylate cyclase